MTKQPKRWVWILATGVGSGFLSPAPGTWGSLSGLLAWSLGTYCLLAPLTNWLLANFGCHHFAGCLFFVETLIVVVIALMTWLAVFVSDRIVQCTKETDPGYIVIDEWVGLWIALWPVRWDIVNYIHPHSLQCWTCLGLILAIPFIFFRLFDIWKPWPIRQIQMLPGGQGIVADDIIAGLYSIPFVVLVQELLTSHYMI